MRTLKKLASLLCIILQTSKSLCSSLSLFYVTRGLHSAVQNPWCPSFRAAPSKSAARFLPLLISLHAHCNCLYLTSRSSVHISDLGSLLFATVRYCASVHNLSPTVRHISYLFLISSPQIDLKSGLISVVQFILFSDLINAFSSSWAHVTVQMLSSL